MNFDKIVDNIKQNNNSDWKFRHVACLPFDENQIHYVEFKTDSSAMCVYEDYTWISGEQAIDVDSVKLINNTKHLIKTYNEEMLNNYKSNKSKG